MQALSGCKGIKSNQRIGWGFLCIYIYIYIYINMSLTHPKSMQETLSPCTSSDSTGGSGLEGGRNIAGGSTLECEAEFRVVHDLVRGYTYSFHPAGVVHMYPLGLQRRPLPS